MTLYVYAVADSRDLANLELPTGIDGGTVLTVVEGGLAAIAGIVDPARFEMAQFQTAQFQTAQFQTAQFQTAQEEPDSNEHGWLAMALRAHDHVVRRVFVQIPVAPLRFGILVTGRDGLIELLNAQRVRLHAALNVARDTAEWRVRVVRQSPVSEVDERQSTSETAWMMTRRRAARTRGAERERWLRLASEVHGKLSAHAVQTFGRAPSTRDVYLVRRRDENAFTTAALSLAGRLDAELHSLYRIRVTGPMPPYSFTG